MLNVKKDQSTIAHSPEPVNTISNTSDSGNVPIMKSRPGPQPGTLSGGRFCSHTCRPATIIPERVLRDIRVDDKNFVLFVLGMNIASNKNINPVIITAMR